MIKLVLIGLATLMTGSTTYAQQNFAMEKQFLASSFDCSANNTSEVCQKLAKASTYQDISELSIQAVMLSKKEEKAMRNRISTLDCCVSMHGGASCDGLTKELKTMACNCRKNLKIEIKDRLSCKE